jgi:UDP-glucose 4-epimerase
MVEAYVLVTGGAGFIGSHVNLMLNEAGYSTIVLDNLYKGDRKAVTQGTFISGDISDTLLIKRILTDYPIRAVIHFAAFSDVGESVQDPLKYYRNNIANSLNFFETLRKQNVKAIVFSSSASVYGLPKKAKLTEKFPCSPISPYGRSKLMTEQILEDMDAAYGMRSCSLRYFNAAGGDPRGIIKHSARTEHNLIPRVLNAVLERKPITIYGTDYPTPDGTCIRDYIHIEDLGQAHILAMEQLLEGNESSCFNLGNGKGFSVREVIAAAERVTGKTVNVIEGPRRAGDPPFLVADAAKAERVLGWKPHYPHLEDIIAHAWKARS